MHYGTKPLLFTGLIPLSNVFSFSEICHYLQLDGLLTPTSELQEVFTFAFVEEFFVKHNLGIGQEWNQCGHETLKQEGVMKPIVKETVFAMRRILRTGILHGFLIHFQTTSTMKGIQMMLDNVVRKGQQFHEFKGSKERDAAHELAVGLDWNFFGRILGEASRIYVRNLLGGVALTEWGNTSNRGVQKAFDKMQVNFLRCQRKHEKSQFQDLMNMTVKKMEKDYKSCKDWTDAMISEESYKLYNEGFEKGQQHAWIMIQIDEALARKSGEDCIEGQIESPAMQLPELRQTVTEVLEKLFLQCVVNEYKFELKETIPLDQRFHVLIAILLIWLLFFITIMVSKSADRSVDLDPYSTGLYR